MAASRASQHPVILTYHSISDGDSPLKIPPVLFAEQMEWLAGNTRVLPLSELLNEMEQPTGGRIAALTFDDGYADFHAHAAPVLQKHNLPATVFLPTSFVGGSNNWPGQPSWVKEEPLLNWDQIGELARAGIEFGSHTASHPDLCSLGPAEAERELADSKREIEKRLACKVQHFCYPYGKLNRSVKEAAARHYFSASSTVAGTVRKDSDRHALPRVDAHYVRNPRWFKAMFTRRFETYISARRLVRRARGQPEGGYPSG